VLLVGEAVDAVDDFLVLHGAPPSSSFPVPQRSVRVHPFIRTGTMLSLIHI